MNKILWVTFEGDRIARGLPPENALGSMFESTDVCEGGVEGVEEYLGTRYPLVPGILSIDFNFASCRLLDALLMPLRKISGVRDGDGNSEDIVMFFDPRKAPE